jgi:hypothetical protein
MPPFLDLNGNVTNSHIEFLKAFDPQHGGVTTTIDQIDIIKALGGGGPRHGGVTTTLDQRPYGGHAINNSVKENNPKVDNKYTIPTLLIGGIVIAYLLTQNR